MRRHSPSFRTIAISLSVLAAIGAAGATTATPASAQAGSADYFVEANGDPMDFSNPEDLMIDTEEASFVGGTNKSISGGQLHFDAAGAFQFDPVWAGFPTGIPHGRDGGRYPIDTAKYSRLVIRINAPAGAPLGIRWFNCLAQNASCQGGQAWFAKGGWETVSLALGDDGTVPGLPQNWTSSRSMFGLRVVGTMTGHFDVDWIRLTTAGSGPVEEISSQAAPVVMPGKDAEDYATRVVNNPWDMDGQGTALTATKDIARVDKISRYAVSNNVVSGCSLDTRKPDKAGVRHSLIEYLNPAIASAIKEDWYTTHQEPGLTYNVPKPLPINADKYRWLTFEYGYEKSTAALAEGGQVTPPLALFGSKPVPGGGANARVFWSNAAGRHPTMAIHLYANQRIVSLDLKHPLATFQGIEKNTGKTTGAPWAGPVSVFRINPNDTRDGRCFTMGRVWLTDRPADGLPQPPADLPLPRPGSGIATPGGNA